MSAFHADRPDVPREPGAGADHARPAVPSPCRAFRCNLVLQRDPSKDLMYVVRSVMELTRFPRAEATHKMWQAHHSGRSILLQTHLERAELYAEQFAEKGLSILIERL